MAAAGNAPVLIVTRPLRQAQDWVARLEAQGVRAAALPLLAIGPARDAQAVRDAWARLHSFDLCMFVSANAVVEFFALAPPGAPWPQGLRAASTGPGTTAALRAQGVPAAFIHAPLAPPFDSEALWGQLASEPWQGRRVLLVRGQDGRDWLQAQWQANAATVETLTAYERMAPSWTPVQQALAQQVLARPARHVWWLSSGQALDHLPALSAGQTWASARALASHARIAARAHALGFGAVHTLPPLLADVATWWHAQAAT